jgi:hypothetical protein
MVKYEPKDRIGWSDLYKHPYLIEEDEEDIS